MSTVCAGQAGEFFSLKCHFDQASASMGSLLLTAGATGYRYALPNSRIMIHQPIGGYHVSKMSLNKLFTTFEGPS